MIKRYVQKVKKLVNNIMNNAYVFSVISKVISVGLVLLYSIVYSRYMKAELRGVGDVIHSYADMIMLILCFGIYQAYPYFKKKTRKDIYKEFIDLVAGLFILYAVLAGIVLVIIRPNVEISIVIILVPLMFAIRQFNYVVLVEKPKIRNAAQVCLDFFDIVLVLAFVLVTKANYKVCICYLIVRQLMYFVVAVINLKIKLRDIRPSVRKAWPYIKFGMIPMITIIMMEINYKMDVLMLEGFGISKAEIGVYSLGITLAQKIWLIPDALKDILLSKLAFGKSTDEVAKITRISLIIILTFTFGVAVVGRPAIQLLYGEEYAEAYKVLLILLVGVVGMVFYKMIYSYNVVNGLRMVNLFLLGIAALTNVCINAFVIPEYGISGAAFASTVSYFVCGISFLIYFCKKNNVRYSRMLFICKEDIVSLRQLIK